MRLITVNGSEAEVADDLILRAAAVLYQARRKTRAGPPLRPFPCRWCRGEVRGRAALEAHERDCSQRPTGDLEPFSVEDFARLLSLIPCAAIEPSACNTQWRAL